MYRCGGGECTGVEGVGVQVWRWWVYRCEGGGCTGVCG